MEGANPQKISLITYRLRLFPVRRVNGHEGEKTENGRKKFEEKIFQPWLEIPDRDIDHLCSAVPDHGYCRSGETGMAGEHHY